MIYRENTDSYNARRYGKPWIAKITWLNGKPQYNWGSWVGNPGAKGILEIEVEIGDYIATGQKDFRKPRNSAPGFYFVQVNGELLHVGDVGCAYRHFLKCKMKKKKKQKNCLFQNFRLVRIEEDFEWRRNHKFFI